MSVNPAHYVLDASAQIVLLRLEMGMTMVDQLLNDQANLCFSHAINLCEVYYDILRTADLKTAQQSIVDLRALGVVLRDDMDLAFWQQVGDLKISPGKLSLADCFALALAIREGATLVTADHHEFDRIVPLNLCPIRFIR